MSLYRKYRPQSFVDVVGQDHVVTTLEEACKQDKLAHAYLFAGNRGTGKTSVARILSKSIMTAGIADEKVREHIVKGIENGSLVDLLEIDAASNRGIDDIRDLVEKIQFSPVAASAKVYIIDEVHMLTKEAFNALLKTLEEPPAYAYFILATTELNKIPLTIQSRCQCFPFRNIRDDDIIRRLQYIVDQEHISIEREALRNIARHVNGGMRDAISLLDQLRSLESIKAEDVYKYMGATGHEYAQAIRTALSENDTQTLLETVRSMENAGVQLESFVRQLLADIREELHASVEKGEAAHGHTMVMDALLKVLRDMRVSPIPGLVLEAGLLSLCQGDSAPVKAPAPAPQKKEAAQKPVADEQPTKTEEKPVEKKSAPATVQSLDVNLSSLQSTWETIVSKTEPASVRMSLKNAQVINVEGEKVTISFTSAFHKDKVADTEASRAIESIMENIFKKRLVLECELDTGLHVRNDSPVVDDEVNLAEAASEIF